MKKIVLLLSLGLFLSLFVVPEGFATSQWSRKYGVSCRTCHTAFPRINYQGEQFMLNGYQMPGTQDGDEVAKQAIGDRLNLNDLTDIFGLRINVTPIEIETNGRVESGSRTTQVDLGNPNWLQLFAAGSIFRNVSIFIEAELEETEVHLSWFRVGFHNLLNTSWLNVRVGRTSPLEWHSISGRLRGIPNVKNRIISNVRSSNGTGDDSVPIANAVPAISLYGWGGPFVYEVGISNGAHTADVNDDKNFWGTGKAYVAQDGDFAGSSVSIWGMFGADTLEIDSAGQAKNDFYRLSGAFNIRYIEKLDLQFGYFFGHDDDFDLEVTGDSEVDFQGITTLVGYTINEAWYVALQLDWVNSDDDPSIDYLKLSPSVWYFPRDNVRIGLVGRLDLESEDDERHEFIMNMRAMF